MGLYELLEVGVLLHVDFFVGELVLLPFHTPEVERVDNHLSLVVP